MENHFFTEISDWIFDHPELSLKEYQSAETYIRALKDLGFAVTENLCGIETAFSGSFGHGKPVIGILGEFDALSGLGHGCGHNLLGAGSLAAACRVKEYLESSGKEGTVIFYGCPGEEGGSGKAYMARDNAWKKLDAALSWHPSDVNEVRTGTNNSSIQVLYKFNGLSSHAASDPDKGRSALDAVELMNIGVQFLREHMTYDCRIHYAIIDAGGVSPNVVQSHAEVLYMTRANKVKDAVELQKRVDDIAKGAALMTGTTLERVFIDGTAELLPNFTLEKILYENFANHTPLKEHVSNNEFIAGSTDVGDVSWQVPTAQINVKCWPEGTVPHTLDVVACGKSEEAHEALLMAGEVLAETAIRLIDNPEILQEAKNEFAEKAKEGYTCPIEDGAVPIAI